MWQIEILLWQYPSNFFNLQCKVLVMKIVKFIGTAWVILGACFIVWQWYSYRAQGFDASILQNSSTVTVNDSRIVFTPKTAIKKVLIFFPGALVDPEAYAPLLRKVAEAGYKAVIVKMPFRQAQHGYNSREIIGLFSDHTLKYCLAGHSKGAAMAAKFVFEKLANVDGLVLIGTTHPRDFDLSTLNIPVLKVYGTEDGVADVPQIMANKKLLPKATQFIKVDGGNHAQFAYYGSQLGDHHSLISREKQQLITLNALLEFMNKM